MNILLLNGLCVVFIDVYTYVHIDLLGYKNERFITSKARLSICIVGLYGHTRFVYMYIHKAPNEIFILAFAHLDLDCLVFTF